MLGFERSDDYQPLFWVRGRPVHVTTLLVVLHVTALMVNSIFQTVTVQWLALDSDSVFHHWGLWRPFTYAFAHVVGDLNDSLWFLAEMFFLFRWGQEVERYFGRKIFSLLYLAMLLTAPAVLLSIAAWTHHPLSYLTGYPYGYGRSDVLHFGVFVVFTTIYPGVEMIGGIAAKWLAVAITAIWTAAFIALQHVMVPVLWAVVLVAYFGTRYASVGGEAFEVLGSLRPRLPRRTVPTGVKPRMKPRRALDTDSGGPDDHRGRDVHEFIDPLLDKISKHGLASLTNSERAVLEKARVSLLRKEKGD